MIAILFNCNHISLIHEIAEEAEGKGKGELVEDQESQQMQQAWLGGACCRGRTKQRNLTAWTPDHDNLVVTLDGAITNDA